MVDKRQFARIPYGKELILRMQDKFIISGKAGNINDGGFFMKPHGKDDLSGRVGQSGVLVVDLQVETVELPCKIVRITAEGLGIRNRSDPPASRVNFGGAQKK